MGEDEDRLAGSIFGCLLQIAFQGIHHSGRVRSYAISRVVIVVGTAPATYRDEGIALDEYILVERITPIAVELLQTVLVVRLSLTFAGIVVVIAHHEEEVIDGVEDVLTAAEELDELGVLGSSTVVGEVAHDSHSIEFAIACDMLQSLWNLNLISYAAVIANVNIGDNSKGKASFLLDSNEQRMEVLAAN